MDSFETSRNAFELTSATWEYFQNGYKAKIKLEEGVYEGYVNDVFIDSTVEFVPLCNRLITEIRRREEDAKKKQIAGDVKASWGEQMRSYVLAPYQMVKDLRTEYEVNNPNAVFDGDLDGFIAAGIRWRKQTQA